MTTDCRNTHIAILQCRYADLGYNFVKAAQIGSSEVECLSMKMKIVNKYLSMLYCYKALPCDLTLAYRYTMTPTEAAAAIVLWSHLVILSNYSYYYDADLEYFYIYSCNVAASYVIIQGIFGDGTNVIDHPEFLTDNWNCITESQMCAIINHAYSLTN